jgi:hypothetical protein
LEDKGLTKNVEAYKTDNATWREEFEKSYIEWVNKQLINSLLDSINLPMVVLCEVINDNSRSFGKINGSLKTIPYPKVRAAADFLGIPPWFLFNDPTLPDKNKKFCELFTNIDTALKSIDLPYISEYKEDFHIDLLPELEKREPYENYLKLAKFICDICSQQNYYDVVHGNWKAVFGFFNEITTDFSGGARFYYRAPEGVLHGNIRINYVTNPRNETQLIKSGWLSIETERSDVATSSLIDKFINTAIADMDWIFEQEPWIFEIGPTRKEKILFTWHSLRSSKEDYKKITALINPELKNTNFKLNIGLQTESVSSTLFHEDPFEEFINIIKTDVKSSDNPQYNRRQNTLNLLLEMRIIRHGDRISLIQSDKTKGLPHDDRIINATIIIEDENPVIKWDYDNKIYSISRLTHIILVEYGQQTNLMKAHINGNMYWSLCGKDETLYSIANTAINVDKTC